jgi:polysaccharide deacetylase 2 family uncharacterized protein YibQ
MPARNTARRGGRRPSRRKPSKRPYLKLLGAVLATAVVVAAAVVAVRWFAPPESRQAKADRKPAVAREAVPAPRPAEHRPSAAPKPADPVRAPERAAPAPPPFEVFPEKTAPSAPPPGPEPERHAAIAPAPPETPPLKPLPRVALIIDDLGYDRQAAERLMELNAPFTIAVLPHSPHQEAIARAAHARGLEVMLHLPMEPVEYPEINPGPGTLLAAMSADELLRVLEGDLRAVPHIRGVNNHMGSRLTARSEQIYQVFSVLKRRGLYFVDSRTTDETICRPSARLFELPFAQRDVFLDHVHEPAAVRRQIRELVRIARLKGEAVAIAHPHPVTLTVLREELAELRRQVEIVPASRLTRPVG